MPSIALHVNGEAKTVEITDASEPLLYVLRNTLAYIHYKSRGVRRDGHSPAHGAVHASTRACGVRVRVARGR